MSTGKDPPLAEHFRNSVFLSYSREDRVRALLVVKALEARGMIVWWDGLIEEGHSFSEEIEGALDSANAVVVLWSARSVRSHWVRDEASRGLRRGRLVPVSIDGSEPPLGFGQVHYADLTKWRGNAGAAEFVKLCQAILAAAGSPEIAVPVATPAGFSRRHALVLGGAGIIAALGAAEASGLIDLLHGAASPSKSIAILPFRNMSNDPEQDYFSEGLSEELRATLSVNRELEVAAQTSSDRSREKSSDPRVVAAALNVAFLLEGSVRRAGDQIRISAQIVDGATGFDKWSQSFDRTAADLLSVQTEVAAFVTDALLAGSFFDSRTPAERIGGTRNAAAFDFYLRGASLYKLASGEEQDRRALAQFDKAIAADPDYAGAHAARSRALTVIANNYATRGELKQYYRRSIDAARRAIAIAPALAEGHSALGFVLFNGQLDADAAHAPYQQSFRLGYGNADILSAYANFAARVGEFGDGRKAIARAERLDPLNATVFRNAGLLEYAARDYAAALKPLHTALSLNPKSSTVHVTLGDIALFAKDYAEARSQYQREPDDVSRLRGLAIVDRILSGPAAARVHLDALRQDESSVTYYQQGQILAQWGDVDAALAMLELALAQGDAGLVRLRNDPLLDPLRKTVRFAEIQRKLGFKLD